jgi:hypothetical protein
LGELAHHPDPGVELAALLDSLTVNLPVLSLPLILTFGALGELPYTSYGGPLVLLATDRGSPLRVWHHNGAEVQGGLPMVSG